MNSLFEDIESHEFASRLNVASNLVTFLRDARNQVSVIAIFEELDEKEKLFQVLTRLIDLSRKTVDPRYENPLDTALAVYLWLLSLKNSEVASLGAQFILKCSQCWWAERIARSILLGSTSQEKVKIQEVSQSLEFNQDLNLNAGESLMLSTGLGDRIENINIVWISQSDLKTDVLDQTDIVWTQEAPVLYSNSRNQESDTITFAG